MPCLGHEGVGGKDFDYVMEETGFAKRGVVDFEEFVEVRLLRSFLHLPESLTGFDG